MHMCIYIYILKNCDVVCYFSYSNEQTHTMFLIFQLSQRVCNNIIIIIANVNINT